MMVETKSQAVPDAVSARPNTRAPRSAVPRSLCTVVLVVLGAVVELSAGVSFAKAEVLYAVAGRRGSITFTTRTPEPGSSFRLVTAARISRAPMFRISGAYSPRASKSEYLQLIAETAKAHEIEGALVKAVVHVESAFNPQATSYRGAMGLMQLMPGTASRFGVKNAYEPADNVNGGVRYLKSLLERYNGDLRLALAAYNAGEGRVDQMKAIPPYSETQSYIRKVLTALEIYRCVDAGNTSCGG